MKIYDIDTMLDPIQPEVLKSNLLIDHALKQLGLFREWRNGNWLVFDNAKHPYKRLRDFTDEGDRTINSLSDLLETECFECHSLKKGQDYEVVMNPFHNMTKEELAIQLDLIEDAAPKSIHLQ